jgi:hypothetical protein
MSLAMESYPTQVQAQDHHRGLGGSRLLSGVASLAAGGLAGVAGTAAMTLATSLERPRDRKARLEAELESTRSRAPSLPPGQSLDQVSRWEYGAAWGLVRGALGVAGLRGPAAAATLLAAVWSGDQLILPPPGAPSASWSWAPEDMAVDFLRCAIYATATQAAYQWLKTRGQDELR